MRFGSWEGDDRSYQIRNIRNPTKPAESCINNVGSFYCSSLDEEYIGLSWGGNSDGSRYFNVITADEKVCVDHKIPQLGPRYSPVITTIGKWLFACAGQTTVCNKLDLNQESPGWTSFPSVPYNMQM